MTIHVSDRRSEYFAKKLARLHGKSIKDVVRDALRVAVRQAEKETRDRTFEARWTALLSAADEPRSSRRERSRRKPTIGADGTTSLREDGPVYTARQAGYSADPLRDKIEAAIDALVDLLDALYLDDEREVDTDFEPSLAARRPPEPSSTLRLTRTSPATIGYQPSGCDDEK